MRNAAEALAALQGGASIVDVKEPLHGPLGRASREAQEAVVGALESVKVLHGPRLVTAALGELLEEKATRGRPPAGIHLDKLGLA
ncbi:MAG TPA: (5-formylfuran-3-yl)methyl phosphate synthase, partial [Planctomycetota bacterium]|nr:(5-formylfuran-3-yl)methyl phosphate synthase [Planctomycetota bacterium]